MLDSFRSMDRNGLSSCLKRRDMNSEMLFLTEYTIELEDSLKKDYIYATRAVQVNWDNGRTCVLINKLPQSDLFN